MTMDNAKAMQLIVANNHIDRDEKERGGKPARSGSRVVEGKEETESSSHSGGVLSHPSPTWSQAVAVKIPGCD